MGREIVIENAVVEYAEKNHMLVRKVIYAGRRGSPDRWFFTKGYLFCIEFKKPGEKADVQQLREHARLREQGVPVYVVDSIATGIEIVDFYRSLSARNMIEKAGADAA